MTVSSGGTIKPGASPGKLTVGGNLALNAGSAYFWELSANTTSGAGTNWGQIQMTSGDLSVISGLDSFRHLWERRHNRDPIRSGNPRTGGTMSLT